ncbi:MAG: hypothetical protein WB992_22045 [Bryobacteraceae bacterium]
MNLTVTRLITASAFVVALSLGASQAGAQNAKFKLPVEARWGSIVLPPGDYTLRAPDSTYGAHIFYLQSNEGTKMTLPAIVNTEAASGPSRLNLVNVDGTYYVQEYVSETKGTAIEFGIPKSNQRELTAQNRVVTVSGL